MTQEKLTELWKEWFRDKAIRDKLSLNHADRSAWDGMCNAQLIRILELKALVK